MCCLKYEQNAYEDLTRSTPGVGAYVETPDYKGYVVEVSLLRGMLKVRRADDPESTARAYHRDQIKVLNASANFSGKDKKKDSNSADK
jgi:cell fate regulator YaaT (PSP1 superfamily)